MPARAAACAEPRGPRLHEARDDRDTGSTHEVSQDAGQSRGVDHFRHLLQVVEARGYEGLRREAASDSAKEEEGRDEDRGRVRTEE